MRGERRDLATRVYELRKEQGLSQMELGRRAFVSAATIGKIERGKTTAPRNIERIAFALDSHPAYLMYGIDVDAIREEIDRDGMMRACVLRRALGDDDGYTFN